MTKVRFTGEVLGGHKQAAVQVPFDPAQQWGIAPVAIRRGRRGHKVRGTIDGASFDSFVVPRSKKFWVVLEPDHLKTAGVAVGDSVKISLEPFDA
jgi:hypothetical protein